MTSKSDRDDTGRPRSGGGESARRARQAEALRANLRRRKDQARARDDGAEGGTGGARDGDGRRPRA